MRKRTVLRVTGTAVLAGAAAVAAAVPAGAESGASESRDAMKVELGRRLFFDPAIGRRGRVGCADCHQPEKGFSDPRGRPEDEERVLPRHSQPSVDLGGEGFHWDGEFPTVRDLIDARVLPAEAALDKAADRFMSRVEAAPDKGRTTTARNASLGSYGGGAEFNDVTLLDASATPIAARLAEDNRYDEGFRLAFGDAAITPQRVGDAVEAYVRSLSTAENPLDRYLAGSKDALTEQQTRGLELFRGKANCSQCHALDVKDGRAALTDGKFHDTGVAFGRPATGQGVVVVRQGQQFAVATDIGRGGTTFRADDDHAFKTPSLRDVARRAPYMHDASLTTLGAVVDYYDKGGTPNPNLDSRIKPLSLTASERLDLVAFLESLSGKERPGLAAAPAYRRRTLSLTVQDLEGRGMAKLTFSVVPCGDRLRGADVMPATFDVTTGDDGTVSIPLPLSTHVRLESGTHELGLSRPIPDSAVSATLLATPRSVVSVRLRRHGGELPETISARQVPSRARVADGPRSKPLTWTLTRARRLSDGEAIYTTPTVAGAGRVVAVLRGPSSVAGSDVDVTLGAFEMDLSGGASETIDLGSAEDLHPELHGCRCER